MTCSRKLGVGLLARSNRFLATTSTVAPNRDIPKLKRSQSFKIDVENPSSSGVQWRSSKSSDSNRERRTVVVTGAAGNLGHKAVHHLLNSNEKYNLILMDASLCPEDYNLKESNTNGHHVEYLQCDFSKYDKTWADKLKSCYACFMFAAKHPQPDASSKDAFASMKINAHQFQALAAGKAHRVIFASSNHVMGGVLEEKGKIAADAPPKIGTKYVIPGAFMDSTKYASSKVAAEALAKSLVMSGRLNQVIILRIGFCQPGENKKSSLSKTGNPDVKLTPVVHKDMTAKDKEWHEKVMEWWRGMYLSNDDFGRLIDRCLDPSLDQNLKKLMYVNGVSNNANSRWELEGNDINYQPAPA